MGASYEQQGTGAQSPRTQDPNRDFVNVIVPRIPEESPVAYQVGGLAKNLKLLVEWQKRLNLGPMNPLEPPETTAVRNISNEAAQLARRLLANPDELRATELALANRTPQSGPWKANEWRYIATIRDVVYAQHAMAAESVRRSAESSLSEHQADTSLANKLTTLTGNNVTEDWVKFEREFTPARIEHIRRHHEFLKDTIAKVDRSERNGQYDRLTSTQREFKVQVNGFGETFRQTTEAHRLKIAQLQGQNVEGEQNIMQHVNGLIEGFKSYFVIAGVATGGVTTTAQGIGTQLFAMGTGAFAGGVTGDTYQATVETGARVVQGEPVLEAAQKSFEKVAQNVPRRAAAAPVAAMTGMAAGPLNQRLMNVFGTSAPAKAATGAIVNTTLAVPSAVGAYAETGSATQAAWSLAPAAGFGVVFGAVTPTPSRVTPRVTETAVREDGSNAVRVDRNLRAQDAYAFLKKNPRVDAVRAPDGEWTLLRTTEGQELLAFASANPRRGLPVLESRGGAKTVEGTSFLNNKELGSLSPTDAQGVASYFRNNPRQQWVELADGSFYTRGPNGMPREGRPQSLVSAPAQSQTPPVETVGARPTVKRELLALPAPPPNLGPRNLTESEMRKILPAEIHGQRVSWTVHDTGRGTIMIKGDFDGPLPSSVLYSLTKQANNIHSVSTTGPNGKLYIGDGQGGLRELEPSRGGVVGADVIGRKAVSPAIDRGAVANGARRDPGSVAPGGAPETEWQSVRLGDGTYVARTTNPGFAQIDAERLFARIVELSIIHSPGGTYTRLPNGKILRTDPPVDNVRVPAPTLGAATPRGLDLSQLSARESPQVENITQASAAMNRPGLLASNGAVYLRDNAGVVRQLQSMRVPAQLGVISERIAQTIFKSRTTVDAIVIQRGIWLHPRVTGEPVPRLVLWETQKQ